MSQALLDVSVEIKEERGMLGIAVSKHPGKAIDKQAVYVFLCYTESRSTGGNDCAPIYQPRYLCSSYAKPINGAIFRILPR